MRSAATGTARGRGPSTPSSIVAVVVVVVPTYIRTWPLHRQSARRHHRFDSGRRDVDQQLCVRCVRRYIHTCVHVGWTDGSTSFVSLHAHARGRAYRFSWAEFAGVCTLYICAHGLSASACGRRRAGGVCDVFFFFFFFFAASLCGIRAITRSRTSGGAGSRTFG